MDHRRSRTGFIILVNGTNMIDFGTAMQPRTATSTPVSEYVALASGLKQLLWIKQIFEECGVKINKPMLVHEDNEACIAVATNPMAQKRTSNQLASDSFTVLKTKKKLKKATTIFLGKTASIIFLNDF